MILYMRCPNCGRESGGMSNGDCDCYNHPSVSWPCGEETELDEPDE